MASSFNSSPRREITSTDIPYFEWLYGERWRPNGKLPIALHRDCGLLLHQVAWSTEGRPGAVQPVKFVINTLDEWVMRENSEQELDTETFRSLYCPGPGVAVELMIDLSDLVDRLERVQKILLEHYPRGIALREIFQEINRAIASISKWDGRPQGKIYRELFPRTRFRPRPQA